MMEALVLAGMSMGLAGVTRPASGCEHHITHYMDVHLIRAGLDYPLHGNSVGVKADWHLPCAVISDSCTV